MFAVKVEARLAKARTAVRMWRWRGVKIEYGRRPGVGDAGDEVMTGPLAFRPPVSSSHCGRRGFRFSVVPTVSTTVVVIVRCQRLTVAAEEQHYPLESQTWTVLAKQSLGQSAVVHHQKVLYFFHPGWYILALTVLEARRLLRHILSILSIPAPTATTDHNITLVAPHSYLSRLLI